ncbi:orotidine-5'-phosphate decarboxylase [Agromyces sp. ISL-38]|uniref:orotidine-5'-phosphate decarboxylase n=1 Tax=Agromyces sp. ISL-38 TaxID=2819107 RepID=UPI001BE99222|nr:orotidine-5'-phosphate decarboxylase [Agromyces sp. ISL-38]MBT2499896.1 orotidine-5'-phosphate decarboxylase [Agromyces sp. ISL-38]MBT2515969.1 orotidine-5'-phosphate decarboxylase [Streptomyces sp. ISL-90]
MSGPTSFGDRLDAIFAIRGRLCVGIDPHASLLAEWGQSDSADGVREFGLRVVEAAANHTGIVKPQVAFFERHGAAGYAALERVIREARAAGLLVIADVKRGDIGSSVEAYGEAWLRPGSPLEADAMTISAYQGLGSIESVLVAAESADKGLFVLAATSNPEAAAIQRAVLQQSSRAGSTVAQAITSGVIAWNEGRADAATRSFGSVGVVLGATNELALAGIDTESEPSRPGLPVLAPGFGYQGAELSDFRRIYGSLGAGVIVSESRSILGAGPDGIADAIARRVDEVGAASA